VLIVLLKLKVVCNKYKLKEFLFNCQVKKITFFIAFSTFLLKNTKKLALKPESWPGTQNNIMFVNMCCKLL